MFTAGLTTSFKQELLLGVHDLDTDVLKIALYTEDATLGPETTVYSATNEVSSAGYTAGGEILLNVVVQGGQGTGYASFDNPQWASVSFATRGALIYNSSKANRSIGVFNFGSNQTMLNQGFQIQLPANNPGTAVIRIV
jgi:hypothetical protein